jgi:hypothetical protein
MRDLDFRIKNKIISNKANFKAFARAFIRKAFEERAELFGKELYDSFYEKIELVANHFIHGKNYETMLSLNEILMEVKTAS